MTHHIVLEVMSDETMSVMVLLGRDALKLFRYKLAKISEYDEAVMKIFSIDEAKDALVDRIKINTKLERKDLLELRTVINKYYVRPERPAESKIKAEAIISLKEMQPIQFGLQRSQS